MWIMKTICILLAVSFIAQGLKITEKLKRQTNQQNVQNVDISDDDKVYSVNGKISDYSSPSFVPIRKIEKVTVNTCGLDCHIPPFLHSLCAPLKPYLHCMQTFQENLKRIQSIEKSIRCNCIWREVFNHGRVHKLAFERIVNFSPHNNSRTVRVRLSTLGRECQNFNNYLCDGSLREDGDGRLSSKSSENVFGRQSYNLQGILAAKATMYKDGWGKLAAKRIPSTINKKENLKSEDFKKEQTMIMWFGMAGGIAILIMCTFFLARMRRDSTTPPPPPNVNDGSLDTGMSSDKKVTSWESRKKLKAGEQNKLLDQQNVYVEKGSTNAKKSGNYSTSASQSKSKCSNCGYYDYDITLERYSVSTEDTRLKPVTKMGAGESESEGEETRLFHSSLMYGGSVKSDK